MATKQGPPNRSFRRTTPSGRGGRTSLLGSLNGGEVSHKINREVVLLDHPAVYDRLQEVFLHDWSGRHALETKSAF